MMVNIPLDLTIVAFIALLLTQYVVWGRINSNMTGDATTNYLTISSVVVASVTATGSTFDAPLVALFSSVTGVALSIIAYSIGYIAYERFIVNRDMTAPSAADVN